MSKELSALRSTMLELPSGEKIPMHLFLEKVKFTGDSALYRSVLQGATNHVRRMAVDQIESIIK